MGVTNEDTLQLGVGLNASDGTQLIDAVNKASTLTNKGDVKAQDGTVLINSTAKSAALSGGFSGPVPQVLSGDGAITIPAFVGLVNSVRITKGSAAAITIATPAAGDDGKVINIFSETAFAHQITCPDGFNAKGSSGTATASAAANNYITLIALNQHWRVIGNANFTLA